ncbi:beta- gba2 type family protein [Nannochloropsis gaditana]|uniref:Beta-gba2 type family protein n=1 Tax=Nannochloropsis gaditana TaxID=72520 RepID=W7U200_9STRA|nr:beta- gba2 type family protein [Nannochloropsis gaditana]
MPGLKESLSLLPLAWRMGQYVSGERRENRDPIFDLNGLLLQPPIPGPYAGVPLGGLGGGCIGRGFRGEFRRWNLNPGKYRHKVVAANQFSVRVLRKGQAPVAQVLAVGDGRETDGLRAWRWGMDPRVGTYHALFPRAWTVYEEAVPLVRLTCRQVSPVLPHDYQDSSLPVCVFEWTVENLGASAADVSIMFSFQNGLGTSSDGAGGHFNRRFSVHRQDSSPRGGEQEAGTTEEAEEGVVVGVHLHHQQEGARDKDALTFAVAADAQSGSRVSLCSRFSSGGAGSKEASEVWRQFLEDGSLREIGRTEEQHGDQDHLETLATRTRGSDRIVETSECALERPSEGRGRGGRVGEQGDGHTDGRHHRYHHHHHRLHHHAGNGKHRRPQHSKEAGPRRPHHRPSKAKESIAAAVCQAVSLGPHGVARLSFALAWDMPIVRFGSGLALPRRYTRFFGKEGGLTAGLIASHALRYYPLWEKEIEAWQRPVLEDPSLPAFYKHMLFNELYFLTDGGTVWTESRAGRAHESDGEEEGGQGWETGRNRRPDQEGEVWRGNREQDARRRAGGASGVENNRTFQSCHGEQRMVGQFLYVEGHEYLMYNTYDVHFYASFALTMLWPMLELSVQRDVAAAVMGQDLGMRRLLARGEMRPRKVAGAVPHDLGCPSGVPWGKVNAYNLQDVNRWKDLGPKLVLQAYRDYMATESAPFARAVWPVLRHVMEAALTAFDRDGDGLIENSGFPDQTYDIWTVKGPSAYTGGLWVAALTAMAALGEAVTTTNGGSDAQAVVAHYQALATQAREAYAGHLWNGTYFDYDNSGSPHQDSIMADQMAGQWYARACGLTPVAKGAQARSSLTTVFKYNVQQFADGCSGAVNGMRPDGQVDDTCMQSQEVWTGTTYSVAAAMLQEAALAASEAAEHSEGRGRALQEEADFLRHAAFETARGLYEAGWKRFGYWFATPEAWNHEGHFRSLGYMRPLSIWAMQWALTRMPATTVSARPADLVGRTDDELEQCDKRRDDDTINGAEQHFSHTNGVQTRNNADQVCNK